MFWMIFERDATNSSLPPVFLRNRLTFHSVILSFALIAPQISNPTTWTSVESAVNFCHDVVSEWHSHSRQEMKGFWTRDATNVSPRHSHQNRRTHQTRVSVCGQGGEPSEPEYIAEIDHFFNQLEAYSLNTRVECGPIWTRYWDARHAYFCSGNLSCFFIRSFHMLL